MYSDNSKESTVPSQSKLAPNLTEAKRHIALLTGSESTLVTLQFFDDSSAKDSNKVAIRHGAIADLWPEILQRQKDGAGVFVTVSETDLKGRTKSNIVSGRAVWADDDTPRSEHRTEWPIAPNLTIETSPGKYHYYWATHTHNLDDLARVVDSIAATHHTDKSAGDINRVLRLAGTLHLKNRSNPFLAHIVGTTDTPPHSWGAVCSAFPPLVGDTNSPPRSSTEDETLIETLQSGGDGMHAAMLTLSARMAAHGAGVGLIEVALCGALGAGDGSDRWAARVAEVPRIARTAVEKYATGLFDTDGESLAPVAISLADVLTNPPAPQSYVWGSRIPMGAVTLLGAHGGTGKSTLALQLCTHVCSGDPFLGLPVKQGRAVFFSGEDSADVIRRRFAEICTAENLDPSDVGPNVTALDATQAPALYRELSSREKNITPFTAAYAELREVVENEKPKLVIIDNASDVYDADEINRARVREFVRGLGTVVAGKDCAIVLLVHVAKDTANKRGGSENYSGSTAWHNSARSRLFLSKSGTPEAAGVLTLAHEKNNYGRTQPQLELMFREGGTLTLHHNPAHVGRTQGQIEQEKCAALLGVIHHGFGRGEYANASTGSNAKNVHTVFNSAPNFPRGINRKECAELVTNMQRRGWVNSEPYKTPGYKNAMRLRVTDLGLVALGAGLCDDVDLFVCA